MDKNTGTCKEHLKYFYVYPARHFVTPESARKSAIESIQQELSETLPGLGLIEAHRLEQRTRYDTLTGGKPVRNPTVFSIIFRMIS